MSLSEMNRRFTNSSATFEESVISIASEVDELHVVTVFPRAYETKVQVLFERHGVYLDGDVFSGRYKLDYDQALNQWSFVMQNPPTHHGITVRWTLPKEWKEVSVDNTPDVG